MTTAITPAEIAESLSLEEIPIKLRCATCNKLAQEAVRLPCCDQNICAECQASLQKACPICFHEPVNAVDCKPNKALRQTVKIFLKKKVIDRENARKKELREATAANPLVEQGLDVLAESGDPPSGVTAAVALQDAVDASGDTLLPTRTTKAGEIVVAIADNDNPVAASRDVPHQSIESPGPQTTPRRASTATVEIGPTVSDQMDVGADPQAEAVQPISDMAAQLPPSGTEPGMAFDSTKNAFSGAALPTMNDFNTMLPLLPNGMPNPMLAGFSNMMNMPGMGLNPMALSQGMFNGLGGPGMMNGMNMGMGFDGGQAGFGGPQIWNNGGQDKFNQNAFGVGMAANNLTANPGYGGYNMSQQGNFNQMHSHQPQYSQNYSMNQHGYQNQGFYRGRGRGRGGYPYPARGRGNYQHASHNTFNTAPQPEASEEPVRRGSPEYTPMEDQTIGKDENENAFSDDAAVGKADAATGSADGIVNGNLENVLHAESLDVEVGIARPGEMPEQSNAESQMKLADDEPLEPASTDITPDIEQPGQSAGSSKDANTTMLPSNNVVVPTGPAGTMYRDPVNNTFAGRGVGRGSFRGHTDYRGGSRGRGFTRIPYGEVSQAKPFEPPTGPRGLGVPGAPTGPKSQRPSVPSTGAKDSGFSIVGRASVSEGDAEIKAERPARNQSHSPKSPPRETSRKLSSRHQSRTPSNDDDKESDARRRERRRRHERRHQDDLDEEEDYKRSRPSRTRDPSLESNSRRSSHRSRHDRDHEKEKTRDSGRDSRRSHRAHREKDRRDLDADESHKYRSSHKHHRSRSDGGDGDLKINGASKILDERSHRLSHRRDDRKEESAASASGRKRRDRDTEDRYDDDGRQSTRRHDDARTTNDSDERDRSHRDRHRKRSRHTYDDDRANDDDNDAGFAIRGSDRKPSSREDTHAQEREARDRERQMKELQRRAIVGTGGEGSMNGDRRKRGGDDGTRELKINGASGRSSAGRKMSVKYEDELDDMGR